jgi:predicted O-methyltransferase YrrM
MIATLLRRVIPERFRPIGYLTRLVRERTGCSVQKGPFEGMRYIGTSVGSAYLPKLLGIYERELSQCVETISSSNPKLIVDIGAAEGYYAIGFARRNPQARVIGFEMEERGQEALREMAKLNDVATRVEIRGKCEPDDLVSALASEPDPVVVCDVEGYEVKLLDLNAVPDLARTRVLVELHDFLVPGVTETLKSRFTETHRIAHIWQEPRSRDEFPWRTLATALVPRSYLEWAVSEWRPVQMAWLWMQPHG